MIHADLLVRSFNDPRSVPSDAYSHYANVLYDVGPDAKTRTRIKSDAGGTTLEGQSSMDLSRSIPSMHDSTTFVRTAVDFNCVVWSGNYQ